MVYSKMNIRITLLVLLVILSPVTAIYAMEKPKISSSYYGSLNTDATTSYSDLNSNTIDSQYENNDIYLEFNPQYRINFNNHLAINTSWWLLSLKKANAGEDRILDDEGLVLDELYLRIYDKQAELYVGKFNPQFGKGWDYSLGTGVWGQEFADEYKIVAKKGIGIKAKLDLEEYGQHIINLSSFYSDNSDLNDSILTRRDLRDGDIGKAGDTNSLSSYVVNLEGKDMEYLPSLFYNISYRSINSGNVPLTGDEDGYSIAAGFSKDVVKKIKFVPFIEYAKILSFNSTNNKFGPEFDDRDLPGNYKYLSLILPLVYDNWRFSYIMLSKDVETKSRNFDVEQKELSISYQIYKNIAINIGRKKEKHSDGTRATISGVSMSFFKDF